MGYAKSDTQEIELCEPKYKVVVNKKLTVERAREYRALQTEIEPGSKNTDLAQSQALLAVSVISWNLDDEEGQVWPVDQEHLAQLDVEDAKIILDVLRASRKPKTVQEEASFLLPPTPGSAASEAASPSSTEISSPPSSSGNISVFPTTEATATDGTVNSSGSGSNSSD